MTEIDKKFELDQDYIDFTKDIPIKKIIVGIDPYPTGAMTIPFIKKDFKELNKSSAGLKIFSAFYDKDEMKDSTPKEIAFDLLIKHNTLLLNASYTFVKGKIKKKDTCYKEAYEVNKQFFKEDVVIYCCGKKCAQVFKWLNKDNEIKSKIKETIHPSVRYMNFSTIVETLKSDFEI